MSQHTRALTEFLSGLAYEQIPEPVLARTEDLFLDWLGSALASAGSHPIPLFERYAQKMGPADGPARILVNGQSSSAYFAALVNAASSHLVEQDDLHNSSVLHPATVVFPAALAAAQDLGKSGRELLVASVAGYEAGIRIGEFLGRSHYRIFHTTATVGTLAAAALWRRDFFGKESVSLLLILPIALPGIVTGIALLSAFKTFGIEPGLLEQAHGGVIYFDEVADMPLGTQPKILRVLTEQQFARAGGSDKVRVDLRVISSTNRDLGSEIAAGRFRQELYDRLNVVPVQVPSLAERREDIAELIEYFVDTISASQGLPRRIVGDDAVAVLQVHPWPGNIRQLRNNIERLLILATGDPGEPITADMLPQEVATSNGATPSLGAERTIALPLREAREVFEREYLAAQIMRFGGNISRTAAFIGMERSALHRKLKSLGVSPARGGEEEETA